MRRIAFINEKGGTCKTTLAVNLAAWLAREKGKKVLLVDLDTQGHCGKSLGVDVREARRTVFDLLVSPEVKVGDVALATAIPNLSLVPSNKQLAGFPVAAAAFPDRERRLADKLEGLEGFDFVLLDSPPSTGLMTTNIFMAAREIVVPVSLTYLALDGCAEIMATVRNFEGQSGKPDLKVTMVVPTLYRRTALADEILGKLRSYFPDQLCKTALGMSVKIDEAQSHGRTIWEYAPKSKGAEMLAAIARELLARGSESSSIAA
jgi:chromosome partitioning protein